MSFTKEPKLTDGSHSMASKLAATRLERARSSTKVKDPQHRRSSETKEARASSMPRDESSSNSMKAWGKLRTDIALRGAEGKAATGEAGPTKASNLVALAKMSQKQAALQKKKDEELAYQREHAFDQLTDFQIEEFREAFRVFDTDGSGNIDKEELKRLMASVGQIPDEEELDEMVRIADADGSGEVDFYEFTALMAHKMADPSNNDAVRSAFELFDRDGDGALGASELRSIMMNVGEPATWEDVNAVLKEVDVNSDGVLDLDEFTQMLLQDQLAASKRNDAKTAIVGGAGGMAKKKKKKNEKA